MRGYHFGEMAVEYAEEASEARLEVGRLQPFRRVLDGMYTSARLWHLEVTHMSGVAIGARVAIRAAMQPTGGDEVITLADMSLNIATTGQDDICKSIRLSQGRSVMGVRTEGFGPSDDASLPGVRYECIREPKDVGLFFGKLVASAEWISTLAESSDPTEYLLTQQ